MSEHEGWVWCAKCDRKVWALKSGSGQKWYGIDCEHKSVKNEIKDLGCMNGWGDNVPEEYRLCCRGNHYKHVEVVSLGRCWSQYTCKVCGIRYNIDSSD